MSNAASYAKAHDLRPGVALSAEQMAALTSDIVWLVERSVTLADGSTTQALVPQIYVRVQEGDVQASGALIAGEDVHLDLSGDLANSGTIAGRQVVALTAENVRNLGGRLLGNDLAVQARNDLDNLGGTIAAGNSLAAVAGRDLNVVSTTRTQHSAQGSRTNIDRVAGLYVSGANGTLIASAGRDANLLAAAVTNGLAEAKPGATGSTLLAAGNDLNLGTVEQSSSQRIVWDGANHRSDSSRGEVGSQVQTQGDLSLQAGNDLNARAATVTSAQGALLATAGRDVKVSAGESSLQLDEAHRFKDRGFLSSKTTTTRDTLDESTALASTFSGHSVAIRAGQDIAIKGSNVVSDQGTTLVAQKNLTIESAQETRNESHFKAVKESGIFGSGGVGFTIGSRQLSVDQQAAGTSAAASTVGSTAGNVTLLAGQAYRQVGSDVLAPQGDIDISARRVEIVEARETSQSRTETKSKQSGLTVAITSPVISAIQTAQQMSKAASQTGDGRMTALAAANVAMAGNTALDALEKGQGRTINDQEGQIATGQDAQGNTTSRDANAADKAGGVNVSISLGSSSSSSTSTQRSDTAAGSSVAAGGNVSITAAGAGKDSDLTIQGSRVSAGNDVKLKAEDEIRLLAARSFSEQHGSSQSSSASIGVSFGTDGFLLTVGASGAHGKADGADTSWTNTHLSAGNMVSLESGGDTTLKGAVASGEQVVAKVGGNLSIESVQDSSRYDSKEQSLGGSISVGYGKVGGSVSASQSKVKSDYASVVKQSGIKAGDGGFQVEVKGTTDLKGAVIASTEQAVQDGKNRFATAGLTLSDIRNKAEYKASSTSVNFGSSLSFAGKLTPSGTGVGIGTESGSAGSTTQSGISGIAGNQAVRSGDVESGIGRIFDAEKVKQSIAAQTQITQQFSQEAIKQASAIIDAVKQSDNGPKKIVLTRACESGQADCKGVQEIDLANHVIVSSPDGKIYVFNHGINNTEKEALENAGTQLGEEALKQGIYTIINPHTGSIVAEVVYAGLDKLREITGWTDLLGISNASQANIDLRDKITEYNKQIGEGGGTPLLIVNGVDHSRGSLTDSNSLQAQINAGQANVPIGSVTFNGAAANADRMADRVDTATGGTGSVLQSTHKDDLVGTVIGGNTPTGGKDASLTDAHSTYGPGVNPVQRENVWGASGGSVTNVVSPKKREE